MTDLNRLLLSTMITITSTRQAQRTENKYLKLSLKGLKSATRVSIFFLLHVLLDNSMASISCCQKYPSFQRMRTREPLTTVARCFIH